MIRFLLPLLAALILVSCVDKDSEQMPELFTSSEEEIQVNNRGEINQAIDLSRSNAITQTVNSVSPAVVGVTVTESGRVTNDPFLDFFMHPGRQREYTNMGSGFIIDSDGLIITNEHVIGRNPTSIKVTMTNGETYDARVVGADEYTDIALLKINVERPLPTVNFGNSEDAIVGEWVVAVGNPFGLFQDGQPSVTVGVVSAVNRNFRPNPQDPRVYLNMLQTDAAINRGNSGGPLVNSAGQVIGVNTFIYTGGTSSGFIGLSFAIPSNRVVQIANQLKETGEIQLDYDPGMEVVSINRRLAFDYNLPYMQGLLIIGVNQDGPAYEAGLLPGDIITKFGDELIYGQTHAMALLREYTEGDQMRVEVIREGRLYETDMLLRKRILAN